MTVLANFIYADPSISGPSFETPLELYAIWNPNDQPLFILSAKSQSFNYAQTANGNQPVIEFETSDYDLSISNQTANFNLFVYSNFSNNGWWWPTVKNYELNIYFSDIFHPSDSNLYDNGMGGYPIVPISFNYSANQNTFQGSRWTQYNYISLNQIDNNEEMDYSGRTNLAAKRYKFDINIPSGMQALDLIYFNFGWSGYTNSVSQFWDMEGYVRVEIISTN